MFSLRSALCEIKVVHTDETDSLDTSVDNLGMVNQAGQVGPKINKPHTIDSDETDQTTFISIKNSTDLCDALEQGNVGSTIIYDQSLDELQPLTPPSENRMVTMNTAYGHFNQIFSPSSSLSSQSLSPALSPQKKGKW